MNKPHASNLVPETKSVGPPEPPSEAVLQKLRVQRKQMEKLARDSFEFHLKIAEVVLPEQAKDPLFPFIIRTLWSPNESSPSHEWLNSLPNRYQKFLHKHRWLLNETSVNVKAGARSDLTRVARLLIAVKRRRDS